MPPARSLHILARLQQTGCQALIAKVEGLGQRLDFETFSLSLGLLRTARDETSLLTGYQRSGLDHVSDHKPQGHTSWFLSSTSQCIRSMHLENTAPSRLQSDNVSKVEFVRGAGLLSECNSCIQIGLGFRSVSGIDSPTLAPLRLELQTQT